MHSRGWQACRCRLFAQRLCRTSVDCHGFRRSFNGETEFSNTARNTFASSTLLTPRRQQLQAVATAACSVQDKVESACFAVRQSLSLSNPFNQQVLAAAAAHVRQLQRQKEVEAALQAERQQQAAAGDALVDEEEQRREGQPPIAEGEAAGGEEAVQDQEGQVAQQATQQADRTAAGEVAEPMQVVAQQQVVQQAAAAGAEPPPQRQQQQRQEHSLLLAAREAAEEALTPPPLPAAQQQQQAEHTQQQQQQQAPWPAAAAGQQEPPAEQRAAHAAQLLRLHLSRLLVPAMEARLPAAPAQGTSAWRALQEAAGRLGAQAAAACNRVLSEAAGEDCRELGAAMDPDAAAAERAVAQLAAQCMAALPPVAQAGRGG